jgi:hypothetical protein
MIKKFTNMKDLQTYFKKEDKVLEIIDKYEIEMKRRIQEEEILREIWEEEFEGNDVIQFFGIDFFVITGNNIEEIKKNCYPVEEIFHKCDSYELALSTNDAFLFIY